MSTRLEELTENLDSIRTRIAVAAQGSGRSASDITLIVVTKTFPASDVKILYELGVRDFGENRDQEASLKSTQLPDDCRWHFQGQIQSNKLKSIANWADVLHSIDDLAHARKLDSLVSSDSKKDIFVQVSLDNLPNRGGVLPKLIPEFLDEVSALPHLNLCGLMAVAPLGEDPEVAFQRLKELSGQVVQAHPKAREISAGMSNDFEAAISQGATHIRIGSQILGVR
ncbi:MAG: YggS family pyridoxal phosphate-dependent enzyme [Actinobacteria bacterium]|jgi:PLP dependent protein|nr:YggS family pyridoxal phosphate-dependent enzyme [Actinomycetota bacterium]MDA2981207.1 YggS family pyridoxal phosphate-dependent enzyme [Actinomycetota bacterium]MDA2996129.1 YggS family pyridoxal phosphate-dependent enzyme [Actinomycetota bacterium]